MVDPVIQAEIKGCGVPPLQIAKIVLEHLIPHRRPVRLWNFDFIFHGWWLDRYRVLDYRAGILTQVAAIYLK